MLHQVALCAVGLLMIRGSGGNFVRDKQGLCRPDGFIPRCSQPIADGAVAFDH